MGRGLLRTHTCGQLGLSDVGGQVVLCGWVNKMRDLGGLVFIDLRDKYGLVQLNLSDYVHAQEFLKICSLESVVRASGRVGPRPEEAVNRSMATGGIEVLVEEIELLSPCDPSLPFLPQAKSGATEQLRLRYRYLDLRSPRLQETLALRSKSAAVVRDIFLGEGFVEVETPILYKSTPEGARDYIVPSRLHPRRVYALPQSPQILKQLLMIGGTDRYFQICRCFRDEDLRADRGAEFTQVDMEASFVDEEYIKSLADRVAAGLFGLPEGFAMERMDYAQAMRDYGTDKPDVRFGLKHVAATDVFREGGFRLFADIAAEGGLIKALFVPADWASFSRKDLDGFAAVVAPHGGRGVAFFRLAGSVAEGGIAKFVTPQMLGMLASRSEGGDGTWLFCGDADEAVAHACADALRRHLGAKLGLIGGGYRFVWVENFPLLEWDGGEGRFFAKHHPFTAPRQEDMEAYFGGGDPKGLLARAYDVVCNGYEIGGGSVRIHRRDVQERMFELLGMGRREVADRFGFFVEALGHGVPPHAGLALGFDRIMMILVGTESIKDVTAFPKTNRAVDLMADTPSEPLPGQIEELSFHWKP